MSSTTTPRKEIARMLWPALFVLSANLLWSVYLGNFSFFMITGSEALWKVPFRFARFSFAVIFPLLLLVPLLAAVGNLFNLGRWKLIGTNAKEMNLSAMKCWFIRPLQGIGFSLLLGSKLVGVLQGISAIEAGAAGVLPPAQFVPARMLATMGTIMIASFILLLFWTLDDLGVRQVNEKMGEVRMPGRFLGIMLPVLFGIAGFLTLLQDLPAPEAIQYVLQIALALYPPFVILTVCHAAYIRKRSDNILKRLKLKTVQPDGPFHIQREAPANSGNMFSLK